MKALVIARREFLGTRNLWIAAPLLGLFAVGLPLLRGLTGQPAEDLRVATALGIGFGLCGVLGLILGAGLFAGDLAQKRAGFFLSRPVVSASLYFGKLLGSLLLVFLAGALVLAPLLLLRPVLLVQAWSLPPGLLLTALTGLLVGHAGAIILRARSPWLLLDLVTIGGFGALAWVVQSLLMEAGAVPAFLWSGSGLFAGTLLVLLLAGLLQVARGRGDLRAGHRVLSLTLAAGLLTLAAGGGLFAWKVLHLKPTDLRSAWVVSTQPGGTWALLGGHARGYGNQEFRILVDSASDRFRRVSEGKFSSDGGRFVWAEEIPGKPVSAEIVITDLAATQTATLNSGVMMAVQDTLVAVSADGTQAIISRGSMAGELRLEWWGLLQGRRKAQLKSLHSWDAWFKGPDQVQVLHPIDSGNEWHASTWTVDADEPRKLWARAWDPGIPVRWFTSPSAERMIMLQARAGKHGRWRTAELLDLQTGHGLSTFSAGEGERFLSPLFLANGDLVVALEGHRQLTLLWCDARGTVKGRHVLALPQDDKVTPWVSIVGEVAPQRVLVRWGSAFGSPTNGVVVELTSGSVQPSPDGVLFGWIRPRPDSFGLWSRLHRSPNGALHVRQTDGSLKRLTAPD